MCLGGTQGGAVLDWEGEGAAGGCWVEGAVVMGGSGARGWSGGGEGGLRLLGG